MRSVRVSPLRSCLLPSLALGALSGCQLEADMQIVQGGTAPEFILTYDKRKTACVKGLTVTAISAATRRNVWAIRRVDKAPDALCHDRFTYGRTPPGYEVVVGPEPLNRTVGYDVSATGVGWGVTKPLSIR